MTLKPWQVPLAVILLIIAVVAGNHWLKPTAGRVVPIACSDLAVGCAGQLGDQPLTVGVTGELKVLQPFTVWLTLAQANKVQARFTMEGMDMGFNLYTLRREADGVFRARVTLPVCVSGRRDWRMTLEIDGDEVVVPFTTEL